MPFFVDTHCHLDFPVFESQLPSLLAESMRQGICGFVVPGTTLDTWDAVQQLSVRYPAVKYALGLHPYFVRQHQHTALDILEKYLGDKDAACVALGEIGLDKLSGEYPLQEFYLENQLQLAARYRLPVILHSRGGHNNMLGMLNRHLPGGRGVVHGFSGSPEEALGFWDKGFYLGVGGVLTWSRASKTRRAIAAVPLEALVLETDSPDMPLEGQQEKVNTPLSIYRIFRVLCDIRPEPEEQIADQLWRNSVALFGSWQKTEN